MNTFIMMWNPAVSSMKMPEFEKCIRHFFDLTDYNWSIYDYKKAKRGDRFFLVKCGEGNTGIVMSGFLGSKAYKDEDWRAENKREEVYYVKLNMESIIHPDHAPILTTAELTEAIPQFDWSGGHSGRLLDKVSAGKLELMWMSYINQNEEIFEKGEAEIGAWLELDGAEIIVDYLKKKYGETCELCGFNYRKTYGRACKAFVPHVLIDPDFTSAETLERSYHLLCPNCQELVNDMEDMERYKTMRK